MIITRCILMLLLSTCHGAKNWLHNLNFDNPANWAFAKLPNAGQAIQLPAKLNAIMKLPESISTAALILPQNGVVLIPDNDFSLLFKSGDRRSVASFNAPTRRPYYSTANWQSLEDGTNRVIVPNKAVPHMEQIPCQYETAIFPECPAPVDLQYHEAIEVKDVKLGLTQGLDEFRHFLTTDLGQWVFYNAEDTFVREGKCTSPEKCSCQPEWVKAVLCANEVCPTPRCLSPIVPTGHCCAICGSLLTLDFLNFGNSFVLVEFIMKLDKKILASEVDKTMIDYHVSVQNGALQLVIVDKGEYEEYSVQLMKSLEPFLAKQFLNGHKIVYAGRPHIPYESGQLFLVTLLSLLMVTMFFTGLYVYYYDDRVVPRVTALIRSRQFFTSPFVFARFDPNNENEESTLDINFNPSGVENLNSSFNNPMFDEHAQASASSTTDPKEPTEDQFYVDVELKAQN